MSSQARVTTNTRLQPRGLSNDNSISHQSFANVFQTETDRQPMRPNMAEIRRRVEKLKRDRYNRTGQGLSNTQTQFTVTQPKQQVGFKLSKQDQNDNLGCVFSPYKQKSPPKLTVIDTSIHWKKQSTRYRNLEGNKQKSLTIEARRRSLRSAIPPRNQHTTLEMRPRGQSAKQSEFKIKRVGTSKDMLKGQNHETYYVNMEKMKELYGVMTEVALAVKDRDADLLNKVKRYVEIISSGGLEFIDQFIDISQPKIKKQLNYSRIMQNVSVIYLMLEYIKQGIEQQQVNLLNLLGHCTSNIIFLVKLYMLIKKPIQGLPPTGFEVSIAQFEIESFKEIVESVDKLALRMQHNNEVVAMLERKVGGGLNPKFSAVLRRFVKNIDREKYSASESSHYLFEYLAYYLHQNHLNNVVPFLDLAPNPYLPTLPSSSSSQYSIVIQPYGILFLYSNGRTLTRPLTKKFLQYMSKNFQLVIWSWMMPNDIDTWLSSIGCAELPHKKLYRYHCKYEDEIYKKNVERLGRDLTRVMIIDYDHRIYGQTPDNGVEAAWSGNEKDQKLLDLTQVLVEMKKNSLEVTETLKIYNEQICKLKHKPLKPTKRFSK